MSKFNKALLFTLLVFAAIIGNKAAHAHTIDDTYNNLAGYPAEQYRTDPLVAKAIAHYRFIVKVTGDFNSCVPKLAIDFNDKTANAYAFAIGKCGRVTLSIGALEKLDNLVLQFVIAHELGHLKYKHSEKRFSVRQRQLNELQADAYGDYTMRKIGKYCTAVLNVESIIKEFGHRPASNTHPSTAERMRFAQDICRKTTR